MQAATWNPDVLPHECGCCREDEIGEAVKRCSLHTQRMMEQAFEDGRKSMEQELLPDPTFTDRVIGWVLFAGVPLAIFGLGLALGLSLR